MAIWSGERLSGSRPKIINLARNYAYQTDGYYASLLGEARGHRVIPTVETLLDLYDREIPDDTASILEELLHKDLGKSANKGPVPERIVVCFGEVVDERFRKFGRRVMYAVSDLDAWADQRSYEATSDPEYAERHAGDYRDGR